LYQPRMLDECGAVGGMIIGRQSTSKYSLPLSPQITYKFAVGSNPGRRGGKPWDGL
jgi:hypothetical protein